MEEAEALCNRLGVMVAGQLHAIGSKQHLKSKYGSGYELTVKLATLSSNDNNHNNNNTNNNHSSIVNQMQMILVWLQQSFPSTQIIYENGGLITYQLEQKEVKMSILFTQLEAEKIKLGIEEYSFAQPTLEQVFIRIVNNVNNNANNNNNHNNNNNILPQEANLQTAQEQLSRKQHMDLQFTQAKCGCSDFCLKITMIIQAFLLLIMIIIGALIGPKDSIGGAICVTIGILLIIINIILLNLLCCLSCRNPVEEL
jgi:hypothetical protein